MQPTRYRMLKDSTIQPEVKAGAIVYECRKYDYGLASDDTYLTGVPHISVTLAADGDHPSFTVPERDLEEIASRELSRERLQDLAAEFSAVHRRPRHCHIADGMILQHLAGEAAAQAVRCVPRYENIAAVLRLLAVDAFERAVRSGFVDC